jgi:hypothetical protein
MFSKSAWGEATIFGAREKKFAKFFAAAFALCRCRKVCGRNFGSAIETAAERGENVLAKLQ